jgi:predicted phosphodiesterase
MRIAIISDVHGNFHALEAVLTAVEAERPDEVWCLGDLVGYGPQPNACTTTVAGRANICLAGNHDLGVLGSIDIGDFSFDAAESARWTRTVLDPDARSFLESLHPVGERDGLQLFHGSPIDPVWDYVLTEEGAIASLRATKAPVVLIGHSHVALALLQEADGVSGGLAPAGTEIDLGRGRWLLNPGSVGQPRDGDPRAAFVVLDLDAQKAVFHRVQYDIARTQAEIRENGLPETLAERLADGE